MKLLSAAEVGQILGVSERRVRVLLKEGRVPGAVKVGAAWVVPQAAVSKIVIHPPHRPRRGD